MAETPSKEVYTPVTPGSRNQDFDRRLGGLESDRAGHPGSHESSVGEGVLPKTSPPDQGFAWVFLVAAFLAEGLVFGFSFSLGVLHDVWTTNLFPGQSSSTLAVAATLQAGLPCVLLPAAGYLISRCPRWRRMFQITGVIICSLSIVSSAFVTAQWQLVLALGIAYGIGGALYYQPAATLLLDWFDRKRGLAGGIMFSASGIGGAVIPFLTQGLLAKYSYQTTMIAIGVGFGVIALSSMLAFRDRPKVDIIEESHTSVDLNRGTTWSTLVRSYRFWAISLSVFVYANAMVVPNIYMPPFAAAIGLEHKWGFDLVAIINASGAPGLVALGYACDRVALHIVIPTTMGVASVATFFLWGFCNSQATCIAYAVFFGLCGVGYFACAPKMVTALVPSDPHLSGHLISYIIALLGLGQIVSGPIGNALEKYSLDGASAAYGQEYFGPIILYTGLALLISGILGATVRPL